MVSLVTAKVLFIVVSFLITYLCTLTPFAVKKFLVKDDSSSVHRRIFIESILNCFSAGVFLGTAFLHLIPETSIHFEEVQTYGFMLELAGNETVPDKRIEFSHFPISFLLILCGFFLVYLTEVVIETTIGACHDQRDKVHADPGFNGRPTTNGATESTGLKSTECESQDHVVNSLFDACTLVLALTIHSVLEGITIGISLTNPALAARAISISLHKIFVALITGGQVTNACVDRKLLMFLLLATFSIATPIGVAIGTYLTEADSTALMKPANQYVIAVLEAISAGMFVYIAFFELLLKEQSKPKSWQLWQAMACTIGAVVICGILAVFH